MSKKLMMTALLAVIALVLVLPVSAQGTLTVAPDYQNPGQTSPYPYPRNYVRNDPIFWGPTSATNTASAGIFGNDVDDVMSVNDYGNVEVEKGFIFAKGITADYAPVDAGYATNLGPLFLGVRYTGNGIRVRRDSTESIVAQWDTTSFQDMTQTEKTKDVTLDWTDTTNQIEVLLGVAGMGVKLGFFESLTSAGKLGQTESVIDSLDGNKYHEEITSYSYSYGWLSPYFEWGMNIGGGDSMKISPFVHFAINMFEDAYLEKNTSYLTYNGSVIGTKPENLNGHNNNYMQLAPVVGANFELPAKEGKTTSFGIAYALEMDMYDSDYGDSGLSGSVEGTTQFTREKRSTDSVAESQQYDSSNVNIQEKSYMRHTIVPSFKVVTDQDSFKYGWAVSLPVSIGMGEETQSRFDETKITITNKTDGTVTVQKQRTDWYGPTRETSSLEIAPTLNLGASYAVIADRLTVNAGVRLTPFAYYNTTTTQSLTKGSDWVQTYEETVDGKLTEQNYYVSGSPQGSSGNEDSQRIETTIDWFRATYSMGCMFNFSENMFLDFSVATSNDWNTNLSVLFAVKY